MGKSKVVSVRISEESFIQLSLIKEMMINKFSVEATNPIIFESMIQAYYSYLASVDADMLKDKMNESIFKSITKDEN